MKVRVVFAGLILALAQLIMGASVSAAAEPVTPPCKVAISLAELAAIGTAHRYAEYVLFLEPAKNVRGPLDVRLTAQTDAGATTPLVVNGFSAGNDSRSHGDKAVLVVLPSAGIRSFVVNSVESAGVEQTCSNVWFTLSTLTYSTASTFDDSAPSIALDAPTIISLDDADFSYRASPSYPEMAKEENVQGEVVVRVVIGTDGVVDEAWVDQSSGSTDLDAVSVGAARQSTFKPAHLPAIYGGTAVESIYVIVYTF